MKQRIFRGMCGVSFLCVLLACVCVTGVLYQFSYDSMRSMIRDEAVYVVASLNSGDDSSLEATKATFTRITLVNPDGTVAFDSVEDAAGMENHGDRPEIAGALRTGAAEAQRYSETLAQTTYYRAVRLQNGQVVRISGEMNSVWGTVLGYLPAVLAILLAAALLSALWARRLALRIATPLNRVDLDAPLQNDVYDELAPLLRRLEQQRVRIGEQMEEMARQRREFAAIADHMREGLVLLGRDAEILSVNGSALAVLGLAETDCVGRNLLHIYRNATVLRTVTEGLSGTPSEAVLETGSREYQLLVNPVEEGGALQGAVLLLLDVTDRRRAEAMRREFTANVSHELKTPLTSISGFAELIQNGVAKPEDVPSFAGRIYGEARRLIALVDDILRLSQLDETGGVPEREPVELLALCRGVAARLEPLAGERSVAIRVLGEEATVSGVPRVLEEMVGNLCDNAVKYNRPGGTVELRVARENGRVVLAVADTGIGIGPEHRDRVFERFYRVDKSHSKETGGTGLGLSIVKHGAALHGAGLELHSQPGKGTTVRLSFAEAAPGK